MRMNIIREVALMVETINLSSLKNFFKTVSKAGKISVNAKNSYYRELEKILHRDCKLDGCRTYIDFEKMGKLVLKNTDFSGIETFESFKLSNSETQKNVLIFLYALSLRDNCYYCLFVDEKHRYTVIRDNIAHLPPVFIKDVNSAAMNKVTTYNVVTGRYEEITGEIKKGVRTINDDDIKKLIELVTY